MQNTQSNINIHRQPLYIGLMSGTSADGVDASLISTDGQKKFNSIDDIHIAYPEALQQKIKALNPSSGESNANNMNNDKSSNDQSSNLLAVDHLSNSIVQTMLEVEKELTDYHIVAIQELLKKQNLSPDQIKAIGFHGQTIYHAPEKQITHQIGNPHRLAQKTDIDVVYDFRRKDIELGGQGAPLIPIFHKCLASSYDIELPVCFVNIGGVSNITYIDSDELVAFDTGPGNGLIDELVQILFNKRYDQNGDIAKSGKVNYALIENFMQDNYFFKSYPKSLDIYHFKAFINQALSLSKRDAIATITHFTAKTIIESLKILPAPPKQIFICGGGVKNSYLMDALLELYIENSQKAINYQAHSKSISDLHSPIKNISTLKGLNPDYIESQGFAYLAARRILNLPSSFSKTTGAKTSCVCGVIA